MSDLISRQDAIDAIKTFIEDDPTQFADQIWNGAIKTAMGCMREVPTSADAVQIPIKLEKRYPQSRNEDITDAFMRGYLAGRSSADRPTEWIPCSERLPKAKYGESKNVLASCESGYIRLLYFDGGNWCYPTGEVYENSFDFVLAWMPLPKPYREDGEA